MADLLPHVLAELEAGLREEGEIPLIETLPRLRVTEPCGCGDDFCSSFYTGPRPRHSWAEEGSARTIGIGGGTVFAIDVVDDEIRYVEIISGSEIRFRLAELFGEPRS